MKQPAAVTENSPLQGFSEQDLIFDVGAHKGEDTEFYLRMGYRVVAIEANPDLAKALRSRYAKETESGRLIVVAKAIARDAGEVTFYINQRSVWGTADPQWAQRNSEMGFESREVTVPSISFEGVMKQYGCPVYLKVDIEGADMLCVEGLRSFAERPRYISIESNKVSWRALLGEFKLLRSLGYTRFQVVNQCKLIPQECLARDGTVVRYCFKDGSSGPFGPYLHTERWLTSWQALMRYVPIFALYKILGDNTFLSRVLSKMPVLWRLPNSIAWYDTHATR